MRAGSAIGVILPLWIFVACGNSGGGRDPEGPHGGTGGGGAATGSHGGIAGSSAQGNGTGAGSSIDLGQVGQDPCVRNPDLAECKLVPSGPACGDGKHNQDSEECDDGNGLPGDGCSGVCNVEKYSECPLEGPCHSTIVCGDGVVGPGEACDDGNKNTGDGCSSTCNLVEKGFSCRVAGQPCVRVYICSDGVVDPTEGCDDGNANPGDGCDSRCRLELGYKCSGAPSVCSKTTCGDKVREGAESCDDGNALPLDGCGVKCQAEPNCKQGACVSSCGDGIILGEECDDGNLRDGDGCSSKCMIEPGHKCKVVTDTCTGDGPCTMVVPAVFRDFNGDGTEFEPAGDKAVATKGIVQANLDADGKPVFNPNSTGSGIKSAQSFSEWYRDTANRNKSFAGTITLFDNANGGFVNRWGPNGEQWKGYEEATTTTGAPLYCGEGGTMCSECVPLGDMECLDPCTPFGQTYSCFATPILYDGNPVFFPLDNVPGTLNEARSAAQIPPAYGWNWKPEPGGGLHNFHFTTEVRYWFAYDSATPAKLDFTGDDDVWVFVNRKLAVDLGGWHPPLDGSVTVGGATGGNFGLEDGKVYEIAVFHVERKTKGSSFRLTLSGFHLATSDCTTDCGDGVMANTEECDDGIGNNTGDYGKCAPNCTLGPRCGDAILQAQYDEVCDDGVNDGSYGGCSPDCQPGPLCGDGIVQLDHEECDDGLNDGSYGKCAAGCVRAPYCGDGQKQVPYEDCDDGNNLDHDGCSAACREEVLPTK